MSWQVNDVLYRRRPGKQGPDTLVRLGRIARLEPNRHGVPVTAVVNGRRVRYDAAQHVVAVAPAAVLPAALQAVLQANPQWLPCRRGLGRHPDLVFWDRARGCWLCVTEIDYYQGELAFDLAAEVWEYRPERVAGAVHYSGEDAVGTPLALAGLPAADSDELRRWD